ncbi:hypothetical protein CLOM_g7510 [Closterium sp. NIES-68]|nr:hypothetical protein CLOM_g7510 [Closterium sp. NIES-68]GJP80383.1 hypothetical protein CLOP_g10591 [Closterium sp. NIES-67]
MDVCDSYQISLDKFRSERQTQGRPAAEGATGCQNVIAILLCLTAKPYLSVAKQKDLRPYCKPGACCACVLLVVPVHRRTITRASFANVWLFCCWAEKSP